MPFHTEVIIKRDQRQEAIAFLDSDQSTGYYFVESNIYDGTYTVVFTDASTAVMMKMVLG